jgi:NurA-like 5'-3' nuclease
MNDHLHFHLEVEEGTDREAVAREIQEKLLQIAEVEDAGARPVNSRVTGVEIAAGIVVVVAIVKGANEVTDELNKLLPKIKDLIINIKEIKKVVVEVGDESVDIEKADEAVIEQLAENMAD